MDKHKLPADLLLPDAAQFVDDEVRQAHIVVPGVEVGEGVVLLRPEDDPGDGHVRKEPVAPREDIPVEDTPGGYSRSRASACDRRAASLTHRTRLHLDAGPMQ